MKILKYMGRLRVLVSGPKHQISKGLVEESGFLRLYLKCDILLWSSYDGEQFKSRIKLMMNDLYHGLHCRTRGLSHLGHRNIGSGLLVRFWEVVGNVLNFLQINLSHFCKSIISTFQKKKKKAFVGQDEVIRYHVSSCCSLTESISQAAGPLSLIENILGKWDPLWRILMGSELWSGLNHWALL